MITTLIEHTWTKGLRATWASSKIFEVGGSYDSAYKRIVAPLLPVPLKRNTNLDPSSNSTLIPCKII